MEPLNYASILFRQSLRPATRHAIGQVPNAAMFGARAGAEGFARRILARYASSYASLTAVDALLRARPDWPAANLFQMIANVSVRPEFVTRLTMSAAVRAGRDPRRPVHVASVEGAATRAPAPVAREHVLAQRQPDVPQPVVTVARTVFARIFEREHRIERPTMFDSQPPSSRAPGAWLTDGGRRTPVEMIVHRNAVPPVSQANADREQRPTPTPLPAARAAASAAVRNSIAEANLGALSSASSADVGRLTDEVVRAIDRRIIAERERKGLV